MAWALPHRKSTCPSRSSWSKCRRKTRVIRTNRPFRYMVLLNPEITEHAETTEDGWEGCLSVPDLRGLVPRWTRVKVSGLDRQGQAVQLDAEGFFARVIQHEVDHLHGRVFLDRLPDLKTLTHLREYEQFWKD